MDEQNIKIARSKVSALIFKVITFYMSTREALLDFPKDIKDPSIICAWHALIHFEADEDIRAKDRSYAQEQIDYLEMIAYILKEGKELPDNIIASYNEYYEEAHLPNKQTFWNIVKNLFRFTT